MRPADLGRQETVGGLTAIRGWATLLVVGFHVQTYGGGFTGGRPAQAVGRLSLMVDLFSVLRGFVLAYVYTERFVAAGRRPWRAFLGARLARIYPLHLTTLLTLVVLRGVDPLAARHVGCPLRDGAVRCRLRARHADASSLGKHGWRALRTRTATTATGIAVTACIVAGAPDLVTVLLLPPLVSRPSPPSGAR